MIKAGDRVTIRPEWQDKGDSNYEWFAMDNEEKGRVTISPQGTGLSFPPRYVVQVEWLETQRDTLARLYVQHIGYDPYAAGLAAMKESE